MVRGMHKIILILLALSSSLALAQEVDNSNEAFTRYEESLNKKKFVLYGGVGASSYDYKEAVPEPKKSTESGTLITYTLGFQSIPNYYDSFTTWQLEAKYSGSSTLYDGTTQSGKPLPPMVSENSSFVNIEGLAIFYSQSNVNIYTGIAYHSWVRGDKAGSTVGYLEHYHWFYLPIGLLYHAPISNNVKVSLDGSIRPTILGGMMADLEKFGAGKMDFNLGSTIGFKIQAPVSFKMSEGSEIILTPWAELSSIGESDVILVYDSSSGRYGGLQEPSSNTNQFGANLTFSIAI